MAGFKMGQMFPNVSVSRRNLDSGRPRPETRSVVRIAAAAVLGLAGAAAFLSSNDGNRSAFDTSLSSTGRSVKSKSPPAEVCGYNPNAAPLFPPEYKIEPTVAASWPGSGAKMTWMLVQSLTGQITANDWNTEGRGDRGVTIKTHYPHPMGSQRDWPKNMSRAVLLIRNPADAIPSFYNYMHEYNHNLTGHSTRAPDQEWARWRDRDSAKDKFMQRGGFRRLLANWVEFVRYWADSYPREGTDRLTLAYEDFVDKYGLGANVTAELAEFLKRAEGVQMVPDGAIECTWRRVVKGKETATTLRKGKVQRLYRREQLDMMVEALDVLKMEYSRDKSLARILELYRSDVAMRPTVDDYSKRQVPANDIVNMQTQMQQQQQVSR